MNKVVTFIPDAGGSIVSKNILSHKGKLRWCVREESVNDVDNGWRFFSDIDTEEYLSKRIICVYVILIQLLILNQQLLQYTIAKLERI